MGHDVDNLIGDARYERSNERVTHRNGYRERAFATRISARDLDITKLCKGSYYLRLIVPSRAGERALIAVIEEACIQRGSTHRIDNLVQAMDKGPLSAATRKARCQRSTKILTAATIPSTTDLSMANVPVPG